MATYDFKMLTWPVWVTDSYAAYSTQSGAGKTQIHNIILHNTDTVTRTVSVHLIQNNAGSVGTPTTENRIGQFVLPANDTALWGLQGAAALVLDANNDTLQAIADVTEKVTIAVKGATVT